MDAYEQCSFEIFNVVDRARGRTHNCLHRGKGILDAMVQLADQKRLLLLSVLAVGDIDQHVDGADEFAGLVVNWGRVGDKWHAGTVKASADTPCRAPSVSLSATAMGHLSCANGVPSGQNSFQEPHHSLVPSWGR